MIRGGEMGRGFNSVKRVSETLTQQSMKQTDYEYLERLYQHDSSRTSRAKVWMQRPVYHCREAYEEWKKKRNDITE